MYINKTDYQLACGDVQQYTSGEVTLELWLKYGCYYVRLHHASKGRIFWKAFEKRSKAKHYFDGAREVVHALLESQDTGEDQDKE